MYRFILIVSLATAACSSPAVQGHDAALPDAAPADGAPRVEIDYGGPEG